MKILVAFSGGKDSQACLIWACKKYGVDNITAVFCDTGWEHPATYAHIELTARSLGVRLETLTSKYGGFVNLAKRKKRFPSTNARFCTEELKMKPMIDYVLSLNDSCIVIQGIRANESFSRSKLSGECMYFKSYFEANKSGRLQSYRKKDVLDYCSKYDASVMRPVFCWSAQQVIDYILENNQAPNSLYSKGYSRVGCFPCIMARHREVLLMLKHEPEMYKRLLDAESDVKSSFFPPSYIPSRFCANGRYPVIADVMKYLDCKNASGDLFEPDGGYSCMSMFHGLCE